MKLSLTEDYLSKVLESAYSNTICEWQAQGISDKEIIDKINQKTDGSRYAIRTGIKGLS